MIRDIIWDFDGTLFDTYPGMVDSFRSALEDSGIEETNDNILNYLKISEGSAINYFKDLYGLGDDFTDKLAFYKGNIDPETVRPFPFAIEACKKLVLSGGRNFIVTHRGDSTLEFLQHSGMLHYFTEIVTKKYGFKRKPDPEAYLYIIEKHAINKHTALVIGDREFEILAGKAAGIKVCLYNTNNVAFTEIPDFNIDSLKELVDMI